jgi:hypothetical protein
VEKYARLFAGSTWRKQKRTTVSSQISGHSSECYGALSMQASYVNARLFTVNMALFAKYLLSVTFLLDGAGVI